MNVNLSALQVRRAEQNTALNAKTMQFITAKISGNALKQGSRTHSVLRWGNSQLQKHQAAQMPRRVAVEQRRREGVRLEWRTPRADSSKLAKLHEN